MPVNDLFADSEANTSTGIFFPGTKSSKDLKYFVKIISFNSDPIVSYSKVYKIRTNMEGYVNYL